MGNITKELIEQLEGFTEGMRRYWKDTYQEETPDLSQVVEAEELIKKARAMEEHSNEKAVLPIHGVSNNEEYFCGAKADTKCRFKLRGKCTSTGDCEYKNTEVAVCDMRSVKKCVARKDEHWCTLVYECPFKQTDC